MRRPAGGIRGGSRLSRRPPRRFGLPDGALDAREDQLARGTALALRSLLQAAVEILRQIDARTDEIRLHKHIVDESIQISQSW
jgi:hypothetical protein